MNLQWFRGCSTEEDRQQVRLIVENSSNVLDILSKICYNSINTNQNISSDDYNNPGWLAKQAHINGRNEAFREIIKLTNKEISPSDS